MPRAPLGARAAMASVATLVVSVAVAAADYRASYAEGIKAIDRKDWSAAIRSFRAAAQEKPGEVGERINIYGMRYSAYLPHYYLGLAYFKTGDCEEAVKAWAESERQGSVLRETAEYKNLQNLREQCRGQGTRQVRASPSPIPRAETPVPSVAQRLETPASSAVQRAEAPSPSAAQRAAAAQALHDAETELSRSENAAAAVARLRSERDVATLWQADPSFREKENKANQDLASARALLGEAKARSDAARLVAAREAAIRSRQGFETVHRLALERRDKLQREAMEKQAREREAAAAQRVLREVDAKAVDARQLLAQVARRRSVPPEIVKAKAELEGLLGEAQRVGPTTASSELERLRDRIGKSAASLQSALAGFEASAAEAVPPAQLLEGAAAYFQGDYDRAAKTLESAQFSDRRASAQARLFHGAARYGVYVIGGEKDERVRQQAVQDVRECVRLDPKIVPSARAFSPRFIEFFKRSNAPAKASS